MTDRTINQQFPEFNLSQSDSLLCDILAEESRHDLACLGIAPYIPDLDFSQVFDEPATHEIPRFPAPPSRSQKRKRDPAFDASLTDEAVYSELSALFSANYTFDAELQELTAISPLPYRSPFKRAIRAPERFVPSASSETVDYDSDSDTATYLEFISDHFNPSTMGLTSKRIANTVIDLALILKLWSGNSNLNRFLLLCDFLRKQNLYVSGEFYELAIEHLRKLIRSKNDDLQELYTVLKPRPKTDLHSMSVSELQAHCAKLQSKRDKDNFQPSASFSDFANLATTGLDHAVSGLDSAAGAIDSMSTHPFFISLNTLFACAIAHSLMGDAIAPKLIYAGLVKHTSILSWSERLDVPQMASDIMKAVSAVIKHFSSPDRGDHVFTITTRVQFIECVKWLMENEYRRYPSGVASPPPDHVSDGTWLANLDHANDTFKYLPRDLINGPLATTFHGHMIRMLLKARASSYGERPLPFNFGISSRPGTGKSTWIAEAITHCALEAMEVRKIPPTFPEVKDLICYVNQADKFFSTYETVKHLAVFLDEMGAAKADVGGTNEVMTALTCLLGEGAFFLNKAAIEDKGKVAFKPYVIACISNSKTFGVEDYQNFGGSAFFRRFAFTVDVRIKAAYQLKTPSGGKCDGIDITKLGIDRTSAVEFKLYSHSESGFEAQIPGEENGWIQYRELMDYVRSKAIEFGSKTTAIHATRNYIATSQEERCVHKRYNCAECGVGTLAMDRSAPVFGPSQFPVHGPFLPSAGEEDGLTTFEDMWHRFTDFSQCWGYFLLGVALWFVPTYFSAPLRLSAFCFRNYAVLRRDAQRARTLIERADQVINRYYAVRSDALKQARKAALLLAGAGAAFASYKLAKRAFSTPDPSPDQRKVDETAAETYARGYVMGYTRPPDAGPGLEPDPSFHPTAVTAELLGGPPNSDIKGNPWDQDQGFIRYGDSSAMTIEQIKAKVKSNMRDITLTHGSKIYKTQVTGIFKNFAVGPWHCLQHFANKDCTLGYRHYHSGAFHTTNHDVGSPHNVTRIGSDLAIIRLVGCNPFKDITRLLPKTAQYIGRTAACTGISIWRDQHGFMKENVFDGRFTVTDYHNPVTQEAYSVSGFSGYFPSPFVGNCGSPLIINTGPHHALVGVITASAFQSHRSTYHSFDLPLFLSGVERLESASLVYSPSSSVGFSSSLEAKTLTNIGPLTKRNHAHWMEPSDLGSISVVGSNDDAFLRKAVSSVVNFPLRDALFERFPVEYHHNLIAPSFNGYHKADGTYVSIERATLTELANQVTRIDPDYLNWAIEAYVSKCSTATDFAKDTIWDVDTCINGHADTMASSMPKKTSAGFPDGGKKYDHLVPHYDHDGALVNFSLTPEMEQKVHSMLHTASEGRRNGIIYKTCPKDEPRDAAKVSDRKIRQFVLAPLSFFVLCKKFLGAFMGIYTRNFLTTETTGGINPFSPDWKKVHGSLSSFDRVINGDFSKFDKKSSTLMIMAAMSVVIRIKKAALKSLGKTMSTEYENALLSIGSDIANPLIMMDRDLFEIPGSLSSGVLPTFLFNNIINCLYIRMAFYTLFSHQCPSATKAQCQEAFDANVRFFALGDDNTYTVSPQALPFFNFTSIQLYFQSIGLKYTNADKTDDVYGSLSLEKATIGKRKWRFDEESHMMMCPIEKPSIMKMLSIGVLSKAVPLSEQQEQAIVSAIPEFVQYGRAEYLARIKDLQAILPDYDFPSYDSEICKQRDVGITPWVDYVPPLPPSFYTQDLSCDDPASGHANQPPALDTRSDSDKHATSQSSDALQGRPGEVFTSMTLERPGEDNSPNGSEFRMSSSVSSYESSVTGQSHRLSSSTTNPSAGGSDSGNSKVVDEVHAASNFTISESNVPAFTSQTATFKEDAPVYSVDLSAPRDSTFDDGFTDNVPLGDFLSRPSKIFSDTWSVGYATSNYNEIIDPWTLWQSDPRIKQKLANYAYASFDLRVRFVINGSPFQYGNLMVAYIPYGKPEDVTAVGTARNQTAAQVQNWYANSGASGIETAFQHFSTYAHAYLNPTSNKVVEMTLPFLWHNNYISLNGTADDAKESLGTFQIYDINPLRIANTSAPTSCNYTVYAWAENMKLSMPTEFTPTSEYADGPVATGATAVMAAAGKLRSAPIIGPFARATEIGAGGVSTVAKLFGFSSPPVVEPPKGAELKMHGRLANVSGEDSAATLSLDPKQEITVDPRTVGVSAEDEMTIKSIVTREQFLARCEWKSDVGQFTTTDAEQIIFASLVNPNQIHRSGTGKVANDDWQMVMDHPAGWLANLFQYWKGSVTYRVEVCCTKMHAGRLKLQFDPFMKNGARSVADVNTEDINARYSMILDLAEATSTEFTINWNNRRAWLRTRAENDNSTFQPFRTDQTSFDLPTYYDEEVDMGMFVISIVNELVAPIETDGAASSTKAPVQVNVYCKMGDDMEFAQPAEDASTWSTDTFRPSASVEDANADDSCDVVEHSTTGAYVDPNNTSVFFGENVVSLRALIKRYTLVFTGGSGGSASADNQGVKRLIPFTNAYVVKGKARRNSYLSYLMPAFIAARGSTRYKLNYWQKNHQEANTPGTTNYNWVQRVASRTNVATIGYPVLSLDGATSAELDAFAPHGYNGACFTEAGYNPVLEFQLPFYSNTRFFLGVFYRNVSTTANVENILLNPAMTQINAAQNNWTGRGAAANVMQQWFAAGDDFSLSYFTGVPAIFVEIVA